MARHSSIKICAIAFISIVNIAQASPSLEEPSANRAIDGCASFLLPSPDISHMKAICKTGGTVAEPDGAQSADSSRSLLARPDTSRFRPEVAHIRMAQNKPGSTEANQPAAKSNEFIGGVAEKDIAKIQQRVEELGRLVEELERRPPPSPPEPPPMAIP